MFILDDEIKKVKNPRIIPLLEEVRSSFYQGNYRSAIAVNYSALVLDLIDRFCCKVLNLLSNKVE